MVAQQNHVDVIAITETWLNPEIPDGPVFLTDFSIVRKHRVRVANAGKASAHSLSQIYPSPPSLTVLYLKLNACG